MKNVGSPVVKFIKVLAKNYLSQPKKYLFFGSIELTRRCNSKCKFCPYSRYDTSKDKELTTEQIFKILDQFHEIGIGAFSFLGGEPLLRKDIEDIGKYLKEKGIISQLSTNGTLLKKRAEQLTSSLDCIMVSLDAANRKLYESIRGIDTFNKVVDGIKEALTYARDNGCIVITNTVICSKNLDEIPNLIRFACDELGVHGMVFDQVTLKKNWDVDRATDSKLFPQKHVDTINQILKFKEDGYPILTTKCYFKAIANNKISFRCMPHLFCCVNHKGEVAVPCYDSNYTKYYSLLNHNLRDIWFSEEAIMLRKKVENCQKCFMHCIIELSRIVGEPHKYPGDLFEWVYNTTTFRKRIKFYKNPLLQKYNI